MAFFSGTYPAIGRSFRWMALVVLAIGASCSAPVQLARTPPELQPKIVLQSLPTKGVEVAAWTPDDTHIITAVGSTRSIAIWEVETGNIVDRIRMPAEEGRAGALLRLSEIWVSPDGRTARINGLSALYVAEGVYEQPRAMSYELDLIDRTIKTAASNANERVDLAADNIEIAADALEALYENDDEIYETFDDADAELPPLPNSHDGRWAMDRLPVPSEWPDGGIPQGGLILTNTEDGSWRELRHEPMQKFDAATLSPTGRWVAMTNDKMEDDEESGLEQSIVEIYDIQTATFEPQVKVTGDYSHIQWLSEDQFLLTETSVRNDGMRDGAPDRGPPPDAVIIKADGGIIEDRIEARCYMMAVSDGGFVGAGEQACRAFPQGSIGLEKFDPRTGQWKEFGPDHLVGNPLVDLIAVSPDRSTLAITEFPENAENEDLTVHIVDAISGRLIRSRVLDGLSLNDMMAFSADGQELFVAGNGRIFRWKIEQDDWASMPISSLDTTVLMRHGDILAVAGESDDAIGLYDLAKGEILPLLQFGNVSSGGFFPNKPLFWAFSAEEGLRLWDTRDWSPVLTTYFFDEQGFLAVTPEGRYDSNIHPYEAKFRWLVPDEPFVSLNPDAFSRDYYAPGLTERWINCSIERTCANSFVALTPIAELNRDLPNVEIVDVVSVNEGDEVEVTLAIGHPEAHAHDEKSLAAISYDPRIFRNQQLVFRKEGDPATDHGDINAWRLANSIDPRDYKIVDGRIHLTATVKIATGDDPFDGLPIFTAYAFNEDRIKSETAAYHFERPPLISPRIPKAYVIAFGIDHYRESRLDLNFAGNDATLMAASLSDIPGYETRVLTVRSSGSNMPTGDENTIESVEDAAGPEHISPTIIKDLLSVLAGKDTIAARDRLFARGIDASVLERATPDDLVIISYAGHGWSDSRGEFYLVTSEASWSDMSEEPDRRGLVSAFDLANWMSEIDAGAMTLVIDACHSAASVQNGTFKPGPLGDPGLGQLAFDKGVRILTATQADDVALEDANLKHGLLTYALVAEGLETQATSADLDGDKSLTLAEWLDFAVRRLPELQDDARVEGLGTRTVIFHDMPTGWTERRIQEPSLFDFNIASKPIVLRKLSQ